MFYNAYFLKEYSKVFDYKMLVNAEYINQYNDNIQKEYPSQEDKLNYAETLIQPKIRKQSQWQSQLQ